MTDRVHNFQFLDDSDDEEEHFTDLPAPDEEGSELPALDNDEEQGEEEAEIVHLKTEEGKSQPAVSSWVHKANVKGIDQLVS